MHVFILEKQPVGLETNLEELLQIDNSIQNLRPNLKKSNRFYNKKIKKPK